MAERKGPKPKSYTTATQVVVYFPAEDDTLEQIDQRTKPRERSQWIVEACRQRLERDREGQQ